MKIFSSRKLEQSIADNQLTCWDKAKYVLFTAIVLVVFSGPIYLVIPIYGRSAPALNSLFSLGFTILGTFVTYYGIKECYATNRASDDKDFIERLAILSIPVFTKFIFIVFPTTLYVVILMSSFRETQPMFPIILSALSPVLFYVYYYVLNRSFTRLGRVIEKNGNKREGLFN